MLIITWIGYSAYTMARRPFSVGRSEIERSTGISKFASSMVDTSFLIFYTIGQLLYGSHIKGYLSSKNILALGLLGSACCCAVIAVSSSSVLFVISWGANGAFQAVGWASCISVVTPWLSSSERGAIMGLWGTNMAAGGIAGNALSGYLLGYGGWRAAFMTNGMIMLIVVGILHFLLKSHPNAEGILSPQQLAEGRSVHELVGSCSTVDGECVFGDSEQPSSEKKGLPGSQLSLRETLCIPGISGVAASYFFHKLVRYCLMFWLPYYFNRELHYTPSMAGYASAALDLGGVAGSVIGGYFSDWYCDGKRRATTVNIFSVGMFFSLLGFVLLREFLWTVVGGATIAFACGFCAFAVDSLLTTSLLQDIADRQGAMQHLGAISGVVGGIGTLGSVFQGVLITVLSEQSWEILFGSLALLTLLAAGLLTPSIKIERASKR